MENTKKKGKEKKTRNEEGSFHESKKEKLTVNDKGSWFDQPPKKVESIVLQ